MNKNDENLNELIGRFFDEPQNTRTESDIRLGDEMLSNLTDVEPACKSIDSLKNQIAVELSIRKRARQWSVIRKAVAAMLVIAAGLIWVNTTHRPGEVQKTASAINWDDQADNNGDLEDLTAQIDGIENALYTLELDGNGTDSEIAYENLELEMVNIDNDDFWKG